MKKVYVLLTLVLIMTFLAACESNEKVETTSDNKLTSAETSKTTKTVKDEEKVAESKFGDVNRYADVEKNPVVTMTMKDGGVVTIELYPKVAPTTVENFISLIKKGFYDGLTFHRVMPNFMAQGGCPLGNGTGGPGYSIAGEFSENGFKNDLSHDIGVISMARATPMDSAGSQFFIVTSDASKASLDGLYAGFGKVIDGMDEVYKIVNVPVNYATDSLYALYSKFNDPEAKFTAEEIELINAYQSGVAFDKPLDPPVIESMTVETFGYEYAEPAKIKE
jgi:peptidyl-prolyl cis-trans isomerase B (cyclophilin B)